MVRVKSCVVVVAVVALVAATVWTGTAGAVAPPAPAGCTVSPSRDWSAGGLSVPISTVGLPGVSSSVTVVDPGYVWDADVTVNIPHTFSADLDVTLTSPSGTVIDLTSDNGSSADDVFVGTRFDDQADPGNPVPYSSPTASSLLVTDHDYLSSVAVATLTPEQPLGRLVGERAAGTWTLSVVDDSAIDVGTLEGWSLHLQTTSRQVDLYERTVTSQGPASLGPGVSTAVLQMTAPPMPGQLAEVDVRVTLTSGANDALDLSLTAPAGRSVTLSTDNGGAYVNAYASMRFADRAPTSITTVPILADGSVGTTGPEEALTSLAGTSPTGLWTFTASQDTATVGGSVSQVALYLRTADCPPVGVAPPPAAFCGAVTETTTAAVGLPIAIPAAVTTVQSQITVPPGTATLHDVDLDLDLDHPGPQVLRVVLRSPTGTDVVISGEAGSGGDGLRARFDDDADPGGPVPYTKQDGVLTESLHHPGRRFAGLVPEGAMAAFRGENPAGVWTLRVESLSSAAGSGSLKAWALHLRTTSRAPAVTAVGSFSAPAGIPIVDRGTVSSTLNVAAHAGAVAEVRATVNVTHTWSSDLFMTLRSPAGTVVTLASGAGGALNNVFAGTTFVDDAPVLVGEAPYADGVAMAAVIPEEAMGAFVGEALGGAWTLDVYDSSGGDVGQLVSWGLEIDLARCNRPPIGTADTVDVAESTQKSVPAPGLLANDADFEGDAMTALLVAGPAHGSLLLNPSGGFIFTPVRRYNGPDQFTYRPVDALGAQGPIQTVSLTVAPPVCAPPGPFNDVSNTHPFCNEILWMVGDGVTTGYEDATFRPSGSITRQAMAAFLYRYDHPGAPKPLCGADAFPDVPKAHPFCGEIAWLVAEGVTTGYDDGTFRPNGSITRQAMAAFLYRYDHPGAPKPVCWANAFPDVPASHPFCGEIDWLVAEQVTTGYADGTFRPSGSITRQAMAAFLFRYAHPPA